MRAFRIVFWFTILLAAIGASIAAANYFIESSAKHAALKAPPTFAVDKIEVDKAGRRMRLMHNGKAVRTYAIDLGGAPLGHKVKEGDGRTPEGLYRISARNPRSRYHLSLKISYPNAADRARAKAAGVSPGGDIFIHGRPNLISWFKGILYWDDSTDGCIAVTNAEMREIWRNVKTGTPIEIRP
jgi:murein L,D-transpeptidase YafK